MSEWKEVELQQIADVQTGPFGSQLKNEQYITGGTPVVTVEHLKDFRIIDFNYPSVTDEDKNRLSKYLLKQGDIVFTRVGSVDLSAFVKKHQDGWMFSSRMLRVRTNAFEVDSRFLSYYFQQKNFRDYILNISVGATMPSINTEILKAIPVSYPSLPEQKSIASILSCLDDKIDLLHRQNATLEKMAETLFRQWFIEDAKEREKTKIGLVLETVLGGTPSTNNSKYWDGTIPWINSGEVNNFRILKPTKFITELALVESNTKLLPIGTTVLAITGATLGQISLLEISTCANQSVVGIIPNEIYPKEYVFLWIKYMIDEIILNETGGAQPHINKNDVNETEILIPCNDDLEFIESKIKPLFKKISINSFQINTLVELRDSLLPRLMSGEITVNQG
jgi:type I restriction enzyme S subunit